MKVLFLDDDDDLRESMVDLLTALHHEVLGAAAFAGLKGLAERALECDLAILDINLGPGVPSGLDAYHWLREHEFRGRILFLTGHGHAHPLVAEAEAVGEAQVLEKPLPVGRLRTLLEGTPP